MQPLKAYDLFFSSETTTVIALSTDTIVPKNAWIGMSGTATASVMIAATTYDLQSGDITGRHQAGRTKTPTPLPDQHGTQELQAVKVEIIGPTLASDPRVASNDMVGNLERVGSHHRREREAKEGDPRGQEPLRPTRTASTQLSRPDDRHCGDREKDDNIDRHVETKLLQRTAFSSSNQFTMTFGTSRTSRVSESR